MRVCLSVYVSVRVCVCLSVCLCTHLEGRLKARCLVLGQEFQNGSGAAGSSLEDGLAEVLIGVELKVLPQQLV